MDRKKVDREMDKSRKTLRNWFRGDLEGVKKKEKHTKRFEIAL